MFKTTLRPRAGLQKLFAGGENLNLRPHGPEVFQAFWLFMGAWRLNKVIHVHSLEHLHGHTLSLI
jgi:hypothetical protein